MKRNKKLNPFSTKVAQPPGTLIHLGEEKSIPSSLSLVSYNKDTFEEFKLDEFPIEENNKSVNWYKVVGLQNTELISKVGSRFSIHSLELEDILNTFHRPKIVDLEDHLFIILKMIRYNSAEKVVKSEQISCLLTENELITFQEQDSDIFDPLLQRIKLGKGRLRKSKVDYLLYAIIDTIVDNYFLVLDKLSEEIERLETIVLDNPEPEIRNTIYKLKQELSFLRKSVWPVRDLISSCLKIESKLIKKTTRVFFRDVYDHIVNISDIIDTYRDMTNSLQDLYLSSISNKMNEIMKVLTIIATIFIPLTFIAGIYGMNFEVLPELKWKFGYFFIWGVMVMVAIGLLVFFRRKKWL